VEIITTPSPRPVTRPQQGRQGAHGRGLAGAPVAEHHHAAHAGIGGRDQQGQLHLVLADDRRKGVGGAHAKPWESL
jgi:hypothetical protein